MYKTILVPLDGTRFAENAVEHGVNLARCFGARCHILRVLPLESYLPVGAVVPFHPPVSPITPTEVDHEKHLEALRKQFCVDGVNCTFSVRQGAYPAVILAEAEAIGADLIVKTSRQLTGLTRWLSGSSSREVCAQANCSVLLVQGAAVRDPLHRHSLKEDVLAEVRPHLDRLAIRARCDLPLVEKAVGPGVEMLLEGLAAEHHTGPGLKEILGQLRFYGGGIDDVGDFLKGDNHGVDVGLVALMCHAQAAETAEKLSSRVEGMEPKEALDLLAYLAPIVLTEVARRAENSSELRKLLREEVTVGR